MDCPKEGIYCIRENAGTAGRFHIIVLLDGKEESVESSMTFAGVIYEEAELKSQVFAKAYLRVTSERLRIEEERRRDRIRNLRNSFIWEEG